MICPECEGVGFITITGVKGLISCPTCEGEGELPDEAPTGHCPACGEPLFNKDQKWCDFHASAEQLETIESPLEKE